YRALDVENIGYVYEGLLEHTVERAKEVILDLDATKSAKKPWVGLEELESAEEEGGKAVERLLKERTGSAISRVRNDLKKSVDPEDNARLLAACHNDQSLCNRIAPYFHLLRIDSWGYPLAYPQGSYMVTTGTDRRETGTHYTPKSLTEAIVTETLEPVAYVGPAEGEARENWRLKSSEELLDLKVCDPAMGSGAFLVQACRWLSERLLEAWQDEERAGKCIRIDGKSLDSLEGGEPLPRDVEERLLVARRLIAKRCLYGVDINPMAVELAKLSIWLVTLAKGRPFSFLDHNLRSGDSLLGIHDLDQLRCLDMEPNRAGSGRKLFAQAIDQAVDEAVELCKRLRQRLILDIHDVEAMAELDKEARRKLELPELIADALVGEVLAAGGKEVDTAALAIKVGQAIEGNAEAIDALRRKTRTRLSTDLPSGKAPRHPMHWPLEFPEVFVRDNGGFDAIVGNPPFLGNRLWKNSQGRALQVIVQMVLGAAPGKIDLCVAFHRRATDLLLMGGEYGLLATSNLAEGSAIEVGLREIVKQGDIHFSRKGMPWPGKAAVVVAIVCFHKGEWHGVRDADGKGCERIGPRLECEMADAWRPKPLENTIFAFAGVNNSKGLAFVVTPDDIWFERLRSERDSLLRPYITGNDITSHALNRRNRWVLDVGDQDLEAILKRWPIAYQFLNKVVRPTRTPEALKSYKGLYERWWQFWNHRADLMRRLRQRDRFIAFSKVTKYPICMLAPSDWIYTNQVVLIGVDREDLYPICLSSLFRSWLEAYCGGGLGVTLRLSISESMAKFPLPIMRVTQAGIDAATHFNELAVEWSAERGSGLTDLMNTIHSKDYADDQIVSLRGILGSIDTEVAAAFGWHDLDMTYDFRDIPFAKNDDGSRYVVSDTTRMEILRRLVLLNKERYEEQVAQGLHAGKKTTKKKAVLKKKRRTAKVYEIPPFTERDI
ncbi:DNA methyltransferase, partial [Thiolapillus sp.]